MAELKCAKCTPKFCSQGITEEEKLPPYCPMIHSKDIVKRTKKKYATHEIKPFYLNAALTEKEAYDVKSVLETEKIVPVRPRIREIAEFAKKIEASKIGMAFCSGLHDEAGRASEILEKHGLEVYSVICSCGAIDKTEAGIPPEYKIRFPDKFEATCNPILQAELLNRAETSFNLLVGLCVGHDMLFTKYSKAYVSTLIVKDRFTGHNPLISLYTRYHRDIV
jgi:uncharacterized metal-binding protein